ncbi:IS21-like element helper ATPase IstB [Psychromonas sp. PT13]|uniref:IS21-like element helper ATPase IstB n=1 Tax=Psychromonas sp. PT13 TaxID=3439547 RepID=UPI003EB7CC02
MQEITQQLNQLKLTGMRDALEQQLMQANTYAELSFTERLQVLLAQELTQRQQRRIERLTRQAKFRQRAALGDIQYKASRNLDKAQIRTLSQSEWLNHAHNLVITGATGCGKTYIACALGVEHCRQGKTVFYFRLKELLEQMYLGQAEGSYRKLIGKLIKADLLIIDDWGLEPLNANQRSDLLELIDGRYDHHATLIISQLPISNWYEMIGESTHADAILDRLVHRSIKIELEGESMRKMIKPLTHGDQKK